MRRLSILIILLFCTASAFAADIRIEKVIDVGPADPVPMLGPLAWSPDGGSLAYFCRGVLMVTDTLGNSREIVSIPEVPRRMVWTDESHLALHIVLRCGGDTSLHSLVLVSVADASRELLADFVRTARERSIGGRPYFEGPFRTFEHTPYYVVTEVNARGGGGASRIVSLDEAKSVSVQSDHLFRWSTDSLYACLVSGLDSQAVIRKPTNQTQYPSAISNDMSYVIVFDYLVQVNTGIVTHLDTLLSPPSPDYVGVDLMYVNFAQSAPLAAMTVVWEGYNDDESDFQEYSAVVYDCAMGDFLILDSVVAASQCLYPLFSPTGSKLAMLADQNLYIMYWR